MTPGEIFSLSAFAELSKHILHIHGGKPEPTKEARVAHNTKLRFKDGDS